LLPVDFESTASTSSATSALQWCNKLIDVVEASNVADAAAPPVPSLRNRRKAFGGHNLH
jgi:hypothetical protein